MDTLDAVCLAMLLTGFALGWLGFLCLWLDARRTAPPSLAATRHRGPQGED